MKSKPAAQAWVCADVMRPSENILQIGVVGFGRIGAEHARWIGRSSALNVAAVFDPTPQRRAVATSAGLRTLDTFEELLGDPAINAVLVSTPTSMHFDHAAAALDAGKHVMIEKPMALNLEQADGLIQKSRVADRVLSVFHNRRWDADFLTVASAIASGALGRVFNIESRIGQWASCVGPAAREYRPGWCNEATFGGGGLYDWGSHLIDQLVQLMLPARPVRVFAQLQGNVWTRDCDDLSRVLIDFNNGVAGLCEINTTTTRPLPRWHIDGTLGSASSPHSPTFDTSVWAELERTDASNIKFRLPATDTGLNETAIWEQFARAVAGQCDPAVIVESVRMTMRILDAARQSALEGRAIGIAGLAGQELPDAI